jgi:hypothetical protein
MKRAHLQKGNFYIGGKRQRIREVLKAHEIWVEWRDVDPETVDFVTLLGVEKGSCSPKTFASWAKRKVEPEEVRARLAMPKADRWRLSLNESEPL